MMTISSPLRIITHFTIFFLSVPKSSFLGSYLTLNRPHHYVMKYLLIMSVYVAFRQSDSLF